MIISADKVKAFDKIQYPLILIKKKKTLNKLEIKLSQHNEKSARE